jgi:hypothetical protein
VNAPVFGDDLFRKIRRSGTLDFIVAKRVENVADGLGKFESRESFVGPDARCEKRKS